MKGGGGPQSGGNILQGGGTGGAIIPLGVLGTVNSNGENGVRKTHQILETNHGEAGAAEGDGMWSTPSAKEVKEVVGTY